MPAWELGVRSGTRAESTALSLTADHKGTLFFVTDEDVLERWSGSAWVQVALNDVVGDADWTVATMTNSWVAYASPSSELSYRKLASGLVVFKGEVKSGTAGASICTLPSGYRPASRVAIPMRATSSTSFITTLNINTTGTLVPATDASNAYLSTVGSFYADGS